MDVLANCGVHGCGPVPGWVVYSLAVIGTVVIVRTLIDVWRGR